MWSRAYICGAGDMCGDVSIGVCVNVGVRGCMEVSGSVMCTRVYQWV